MPVAELRWGGDDWGAGLTPNPITGRATMRVGRVMLITLALGGTSLLTAAARTGALDWVLLGQRTVTDRADHDVIVVTGARGGFKSIKITVQRASVDFHRVGVHYGNGT